MSTRDICRECDWVGNWTDLLSAPDPFNEGCLIYACPKCRAVERIGPACEIDGCDKEATCGGPTPTGYLTTCYEHSVFRVAPSDREQGAL